jgi:general secretion pathway protein A
MYLAFYGLREQPFDLTPNPRFLFLTPRHREALSTLRYGLSIHRGLALLLGDAGTGKTTVVRAALAAEQRPSNRYVLLNNPTLSRTEFYEYLATGFRFSQQAAHSKTRFLFELQHDAQQRLAAGGVTALILDEAQSLPYELLEEVRLLANIETATSKLLNVILVGQPELADRLNDPSLRQLKQRVTLRCELTPLSLKETMAYVAARLRIAGGNAGEIFTREAVLAIHDASGGLPRTVSVVCENALLSGFAANRKPVDEEIVYEVSRDFALDAGAVSGGNGRADGAYPPHRGEAAVPISIARPPAEPAAVGGAAPAFGKPQKRRRFIFF